MQQLLLQLQEQQLLLQAPHLLMQLLEYFEARGEGRESCTLSSFGILLWREKEEEGGSSSGLPPPQEQAPEPWLGSSRTP